MWEVIRDKEEGGKKGIKKESRQENRNRMRMEGKEER